MNNKLSAQQIGSRIRRIRIENGFSQEEIAKVLRISRSSVVQLEKGNRQVSVIELSLLSEMLGFSMDQLLSGNYETEIEVEVVAEPEIDSKLLVMRDSVPKLKRKKLETVILYILEMCGAKPRMESKLLLSMLYFCDFNLYELHEEQLTGLLYIKHSFGPSPDKITGILKEMETAGKLLRTKCNYKGVPGIKYLPQVQANLMYFSAAEKEIIDRVIEQFSNWPASALNDYSLRDIPVRATKQGNPIEYELVFYRRSPYTVRIYDEDWYG